MTEPDPLADWTLERDADADIWPHQMTTPNGVAWLTTIAADQFERAKAITAQATTPRRFTARYQGNGVVRFFDGDAQMGRLVSYAAAEDLVAEFNAPAPAPAEADDCAGNHCHNGLHRVQTAVDDYDSWPCPKYAAEAIAWYERTRPAEDLPPGVVRYDDDTLIARGDVVRGLPDDQWERRFGEMDEWISGGDVDSGFYEVRRIVPPATVTITLPEDVARQLAENGDDWLGGRVGEQISAACRAATVDADGMVDVQPEDGDA